MSECNSKFLIKNGEVVQGEEFSDEEIKIGRSIYEVIRVIDGVPLFLEQHLDRFHNSASLIGENMLLSDEEIKVNMRKLIEEEKRFNGNIKLVFNYRENKRDYYIYFLKHTYPIAKMYAEGVDTMLYHGERANPNAKVIDADFRKKVDAAIKECKVFEAILVDRDGYITEGSKSNIFMVHSGRIITSPVEAVLPGITRNIIIELIENAGIPFSEERYHFEKIGDLEGLFISGTSPKVLPIKRVDNYNFDSADHELIKKVKELFDEKITNYISENKF
ncbi:aminotransferase class IV [Clostridium thermarum]|uniref:aminotransferase class IV n=1 Tax=Clostridium thermarum TaxID=1716543 RepID=UPI0013D5CB96|nr:aminotransferase class IV [Clostridium thermarum]